MACPGALHPSSSWYDPSQPHLSIYSPTRTSYNTHRIPPRLPPPSAFNSTPIPATLSWPPSSPHATLSLSRLSKTSSYPRALGGGMSSFIWLFSGGRGSASGAESKGAGSARLEVRVAFEVSLTSITPPLYLARVMVATHTDTPTHAQNILPYFSVLQ